MDGAAAVDDLQPFIDLDPRTAEERRGSTTVAGFVLSVLGRLPPVGEHVDYSGARFTVERMAGCRVDLVRVRPLPPGRAQSTP